jgi:hypothetical protein
MILPDEERDWIEKYRQAMDAKAVEESRLHRIRRAWSRIASAVGAARSWDGSARDSNESDRDTRLVIQTNSAEPAGLLNKSSAFEPEQIREASSSADDEAEYAC